MKNNHFNINRFGRLFSHNLIENYKLISFAVAGFCGGTFILLLLIQSVNNFRPTDYDTFFGTFIFLFAATGIIYTGMSFPGFRTKEKSFNFLLLPASSLEKYVMEFLTRIILFIIAMPLLYLLVFVLENYFVAMVYSGYYFNAGSFFDGGIFNFNLDVVEGWPIVLIISLVLMAFNIPFTGATIFRKFPLVKTLFAIAIIFFFHVFLIFFYLKVLGFESHANHQMSILGIHDDNSAIRFFAIYSIIVNLALIAASYLKLKEKEV